MLTVKPDCIIIFAGIYDPQSAPFTIPDPLGLEGGWDLYQYAPNPLGWMVLLMKESQSKPLSEKSLGVNMTTNLKNKILSNKDDLTEGTFCYLLFEEATYDENLLSELIDDVAMLFEKEKYDDDVIKLLSWIISGVDICFNSHNDKDDLYLIVNYDAEEEKCWEGIWKPKLISFQQKPGVDCTFSR